MSRKDAKTQALIFTFFFCTFAALHETLLSLQGLLYYFLLCQIDDMPQPAPARALAVKGKPGSSKPLLEPGVGILPPNSE